jgi:hypothetical protein
MTQFIEICTALHQHFAQNIWPKHPRVITVQVGNQTFFPCFHSQHHINAVMKASKAVGEALLNNSDPFQIKNNLKKWNTLHNDSVSIHDFVDILPVAFAGHDLGNLVHSDKVQKNSDTVVLDFSNRFQLEVGESEKNSASITAQLLDSPFLELIQHLILQTIFHPTLDSSEEPFWLLIQTIDQIGGHFFSDLEQHQASAGYLNELYVAKEDSERTPLGLKSYLNFLPNRFKLMVPDDHNREEILAIFDPTKEREFLMHNYDVKDRPIDYHLDIPLVYTNHYARTPRS